VTDEELAVLVAAIDRLTEQVALVGQDLTYQRAEFRFITGQWFKACGYRAPEFGERVQLRAIPTPPRPPSPPAKPPPARPKAQLPEGQPDVEIAALPLTVRAMNALLNNEIKWLSELAACTSQELLCRIPNFSRVSYAQVYDVCISHGLWTDRPPPKLPKNYNRKLRPTQP
jgi:hypothetical protein